MAVPKPLRQEMRRYLLRGLGALSVIENGNRADSRYGIRNFVRQAFCAGFVQLEER